MAAAPLAATAQGKPAAPAQGKPAVPASSSAPANSSAPAASAAPSASPAPAALPDSAADLYRQHMDVGISFYEQKNYPAAIAEFQEAYKARPKASPLVNMALCYKAQFAYTRAIKALEKALSQHADTMDENDKKAAQTEIEEMRARLSYVTFKVTPPDVAVEIDGEAIPDAASGSPVALSPGPHDIKITADGFADVEQQVTVASGQRLLEYTLIPNKGFVRIKAPGPKFEIAVDAKVFGTGEWAGLIPPGAHTVEWYVPRSGSVYRVRLDVEAGRTYELSPGKGGIPVTETGDPVPPKPPPTPKPVPVTGFFALATVSPFWPTEQPRAFKDEGMSPGISVGARGGYRVNTPVSFDAMVAYSNLLVRRQLEPDISYSLELFRAGLNMRLQTPGRIARFYGNFGGGFVFDSLDFNYDGVADGLAKCTNGNATVSCKDGSGFDGYLLMEAGLQFNFGNVLVDGTFGTIFQSTRGFGLRTYNDWLPLIEVGIRVGYSTWGP
ncbi:MAG: tetratricopeptide repeat protein [Polyangiaceae bacterium]